MLNIAQRVILLLFLFPFFLPTRTIKIGQLFKFNCNFIMIKSFGKY